MRLRFLIFLTFSSIAVLPVIALATWIFNDALEREIESVRDKHLVIAKNVGEALQRYSIDLKNGFELIASLPRPDYNAPSVTKFMRSLNFDHFCVANLVTGVVVAAIAPESLPCPKQVPTSRFQKFVSLLEKDRIVFSPVMMSPNGYPVLYLLRAYGDKLVIGAVSTKYIVKQGKAVSFGQKGHAAIVDHTGQVIAHPLPSWQNPIKDMAKVPPVQRMMARKTGTMEFFSPALKANMVSGYTFVPATGWGVMVPQPIAEIQTAAILIQNSAIGISLVGVIVAALLSWFLSGYLTRSLSAVVGTTRRMTAGDLEARVTIRRGFEAKEIKELGLTFNAMADEISKTHRILSEAVIQADTANHAKSEFLATMSHDLRTPLNAIIGFTEVMRSKMFGPLGDDRYDEYLGDIEKSGNVLLSLINDILDLSKIEAGRYQLNETEVDLAVFLENAIELASIQARENGIRLDLSITQGLPNLLCDERTLMQVVNNLLSNAVKFSHPNGRVVVAARRDGSGSLKVEFADQGIGMTPRDIEEVLKPFSQADSRKSRAHEGTGLGLPISQKFMELHGGNLEIESELDVGTTVTIRFPAARALAAPAMPSSAARQAP